MLAPMPQRKHGRSQRTSRADRQFWRRQPRRNLRRSVTTAGAKISTAPTSSAGTLSTQAKNVGVITDTTRSTPASLSCRLATAADAITAEAEPTTEAIRTRARASALTAPIERSATVNPTTAHTIDPIRITCRSSTRVPPHGHQIESGPIVAVRWSQCPATDLQLCARGVMRPAFERLAIAPCRRPDLRCPSIRGRHDENGSPQFGRIVRK